MEMEDVYFDNQTPYIIDASKVRSIMGIDKDTGLVGNVSFDLFVFEAGKNVASAVKITGNVLPILGNANKSAFVFGGPNGRILTFPGGSLNIKPNYLTLVFYDGTSNIWSIQDEDELRKGADGTNGKTTEPFNASKAGGYLAGDQIYFSNNSIYSALVNTSMGESPDTAPSKWGIIFNNAIKTWSARSYRQGDQVIHKKNWWEAVVNTTSAQEPSIVAETIWKKVIEGGVKDLGADPNLDSVTVNGVYSFNRTVGAGTPTAYKGTEKDILIVNEISSIPGNEVYQYLINNKISFRKKNADGWTAFTPYLDRVTDITDRLYVKGTMSWNIVDPKLLRKCSLTLWNEAGLIIDGANNIYYFIPVEVGVEYICKSGNITLWCYDEAQNPISGTKATIAVNVPITFTGATKYIAISMFTAGIPVKFGKNVLADYDEPFGMQIQKKDIKGFPHEETMAIVGNARSLQDAGITVSSGNYNLKKIGVNNYTLKTKFNINNLHNVDTDTALITINNGTEDVVKVELLNRKTSRDFAIPKINTKLKITTKQASTEVDVTGLVNQMAGRDVFSVRRVDPAFTEYKFMQGGVYNEALDIANYTLTQADLGWVMKVGATGIEITRYDYTLVSNVLTIGSNVQETISVPFNPNELLDDYLKRLPALLGNRFEVRTRYQDATIKCTDLVYGEMQMCRWFKPLQTQYRRMDIPSRLMSVFIVDSYPCQVQIQRQTDFELVLSYYNNAGWYNHYLAIDDVIVLRDRRNVAPLYTNNQTVTFHSAGISLSSISYNLLDYYTPVPIIAFTGHWQADMPEFLVASEAQAQLGYRTTTGRIAHIMKSMKDRGFEQITIAEFMQMKQGLKPWRKAYFWCMDDSITILTSNGTYDNKISTHQKLSNMGYAFTAGINMSSMDGLNSSYEATLTQVDVDFYKQYGELFNHSYFHSSHDYLSALQLIHFLEMHEKLVRLHGLRVQRMYAYPFNEAKYFNSRLIRSYGYPAITSHFGSNSAAAVFKGTNDCNLSRITIDDLVSWTQVETAINTVGIFGGRYDFY